MDAPHAWNVKLTALPMKKPAALLRPMACRHANAMPWAYDNEYYCPECGASMFIGQQPPSRYRKASAPNPSENVEIVQGDCTNAVR